MSLYVSAYCIYLRYVCLPPASFHGTANQRALSLAVSRFPPTRPCTALRYGFMFALTFCSSFLTAHVIVWVMGFLLYKWMAWGPIRPQSPVGATLWTACKVLLTGVCEGLCTGAIVKVIFELRPAQLVCRARGAERHTNGSVQLPLVPPAVRCSVWMVVALPSPAQSRPTQTTSSSASCHAPI